MKRYIFHKESGAATLLITTLLIISITMIGIFAANYGLMQQKITSNSIRNQQAFEAAEAGLEFGINYLNQNSSLILANPVNGYLPIYSDSSITNVTLENGSRFTVVYSNPIANNYNLIQISATGTSSDGTGTHTALQQVQYGSLLYSIPQNPLTNIDKVRMRDSAILKNLQGNTTIKSGSSTTLTGSALTILLSGPSSTSFYTGPDIQQNISALASKSSNDFFASYFGISPTAAKNKANYLYTNLGNYSSVLNGKAGTTIWIDESTGNAYINSNTQIGTTAAPVLIFINGDLNLSENANITGFVVILGTGISNTSNNAQINGGVVSVSELRVNDNSSITFDKNILTTLQNVTNQYYAKVAGSWRDF